jgi:molecular chaperone HscB
MTRTAALADVTSPSANHFELFGLPVTFAIDANALDEAYRALQTEVHPDRYAGGSDAERRAASEQSARINEAYKVLKNPVERGRYLLALRGVDAFDETDTRLSVDFLEAQLARRERAAEAAESDDVETLEAILAEVRGEVRDRQEQLARLLSSPSHTEAAKAGVRELRFLAKVAEDVDAMLAALD